MYYFFRIFFLVLLSQSIVYSQQNAADSLEQLLTTIKGEKKVDVYGELADIYQYINTQTAIDYAQKGIVLAEKINYPKGLAGVYGSLGFCYINLDNSKAIAYTQKAYSIRKKINDKPGIATSLNVLGVISYYNGDYITAIEYHLEAIKLREEIGDDVRAATSYNNIALIYITLENYEPALEYLNKALKIRIATNNKRGIGIIKTNIGDIYSKMEKYEEALKYFNEGMELNIETGNKKSEANSYHSLAVLYSKTGDVSKSLSNYNLALAIYMDIEEMNGLANVQNGIASLYRDKGEISQALNHANIALSYAKPIRSLDNISRAADILQFCYRKMGVYDSAYKYISLYLSSYESLKSSDKLKKLAKIELDFKINKLKRDQEAELNKQKNFVQFLLLSLVLGLVIVILIVREFRQKKKTNIQLQKLNEQLKELNSTKDRFISIMAHDLRGPFQSFLSSSEILANQIDTLDKEEIVSLSRNLNTSLNKQFDLLNDLLDWAKLQAGNYIINCNPVCLFDIVEEVIEQIAFTAGQKNIKIKNNISQDIKIFADSTMIRLVFRNLISNSIKFTKPGGLVEISAERKNSSIEVIVKDNGIGIDEKDLKNLFRVDIINSTKGTANESGSGLGLILCNEIIQKHGGSLTVKSELNKGSQFTFTLPSA